MNVNYSPLRTKTMNECLFILNAHPIHLHIAEWQTDVSEWNKKKIFQKHCYKRRKLLHIFLFHSFHASNALSLTFLFTFFSAICQASSFRKFYSFFLSLHRQQRKKGQNQLSFKTSRIWKKFWAEFFFISYNYNSDYSP